MNEYDRTLGRALERKVDRQVIDAITPRPWFVTLAEGIAGPPLQPPIMYRGRPTGPINTERGGITYVEASALKWPLRPTKRREWRI